tara:strand:+ start:137 stop:316 length:180 start_codon:yes stop_codon:yes gene_type:complete
LQAVKTNKMTYMEDLLRLKQARIAALEAELSRLRGEVEECKMKLQNSEQQLKTIYDENR